MFKVARRDDYKCQLSFKPVRDDEIEFDHVIPVAKGGPTTVANIRLLCRDCNRTKGDSTKDLVYGMYWYMKGCDESESS
jgi:5-methylcytosine-specific restriction endonuclease McrA